jgi:phosphate transport system protein
MSESSPRHILGTFETALANQRSNILMMASLTERGIGLARKALFERDTSAALSAIADDEEIDSLEIQVDREGMDIIMKYQPVASDLRSVISGMKIGSNLERVADQSVGIARRARKLNEHPALSELTHLHPMFELAGAMFRDSVRAYAEADLELARSLKARDRELDEMNRDVAKKIVQAMAGHTEAIAGYMNLVFVARFLERVGDHATNIGEDVVFAYAAEDIRHASSPSQAG